MRYSRLGSLAKLWDFLFDDWLAVGDAAWTLDPLSGAGVERAVRDGARAADALSESIRLPRSLHELPLDIATILLTVWHIPMPDAYNAALPTDSNPLSN